MICYFDNAATTQPCPEAVAAIENTLHSCWGNPSSIHSLGIAAERLLMQARISVSKALGCDAENIFFTSGGTEADNWAIFGTAQKLGKRGRHIVTTSVEHHAVLNPMKRLEEQGFTVTYLAPDEAGCISAEQLAQALRPDTILVSVMTVNNETGAVMPIEQMVKHTRRISPSALFHTDAVQAFGKLPFRAGSLGVDLLSISAHKVHGIKGAGALYIRKGLHLPPLLLGGGQERGNRSGTEAVPAISAFGAACAAMQPTMRRDVQEQQRLKTLLQEKLAAISDVVLLGAQEAPHIVCFALRGVRSQGLVNCLQEQGVYVSAGSACAKGRRSHVLSACGIVPELIDGSVRASLSRFTTEADIDRLVQSVRLAADTLR